MEKTLNRSIVHIEQFQALTQKTLEISIANAKKDEDFEEKFGSMYGGLNIE